MSHFDKLKTKWDMPIALAGFGLGLALSLSLPGAAKGMGVVTSAAAVGYGIRSAQSRGSIEEVQRDIEQETAAAVEAVRLKLEIKELRIKELTQELSDKIREFAAEKEEFEAGQETIAQLEKELSAANGAYYVLRGQLSQQQKAFSQELQQAQEECLKKLKALEEQHAATIQQKVEEGVAERLEQERCEILRQFNTKINRYVNRQVEVQRELKARLQETQEVSAGAIVKQRTLAEAFKDECYSVVSQLEEWITQTEQWKALAAEQFQMAMISQEAQYQGEIERLYAQISEFLKPQRLNSLDPASLTANQVADWFLREHNILIDVVKAKPYTDRHEIWFKPRMGTLKQFKEHTESLWLEFELAKEPEFSVDEGCVKAVLTPAETLDDSVTFTAKAGKDEVVDEVEASDGTKFKIYNLEDRLRHWIRNTERYHFFVSGDSGSGKDTFFSNIADLLEQELNPEGSPDAIGYEVIDAKDPNDTPLKIRGKVLRPKYRGINYPSMDEKYWSDCDVSKGFAALQDEVGYRMVIGRQAADKGLPVPSFQPRIWFVSELEESISVLGTSPRDSVLSAARLGRSLNIAVIVNGQSGQVSSYKMISSNLLGFACVFLRENATIGAQQLCPVASDRKPLLRGISYLKAQAEGTDKRDPRRYWGLVKLQGEPPFLAYMPKPNAFSKVARVESGEMDQGIENLAEETEETIAPLPVISGAQELMQMIETRRRELSGEELREDAIDVQVAEPEDEPEDLELAPRKSNLDLVLDRLSIPAQCVFKRYLEKGLIGQSVNVRWVQRTGITNADMRRDMKKPKVIGVFQELAGAGLGVFDSETEKWCYLGIFEENREHDTTGNREALQQAENSKEAHLAGDQY